MDTSVFKTAKVFLRLNNNLKAVKHPSIPPLECFVGFERQKELLKKNTLALLERKPFNDVLLWGKRGTGKSSLVRSMLNLSSKLKLLQVDREEVDFLFEFLDNAHDMEEFSFIILLEDLTFDRFEERSIRLLKTLLDGSVVERPKNVVFYATSNVRNLTFKPTKENSNRELEEELFSLVDRFGLRLGFTDFSKEDYLKAVRLHLERLGLKFDRKVERSALEFAAERGFSGRVANQFVRFWLSTADR